MHDDRSRKLSPAAIATTVGAIAVLLAGAYTLLTSKGPRPSPSSQPSQTSAAQQQPEQPSTPEQPVPFVRDQLFFAGWEPGADKPVLAAMILQREPLPSGATVEVKAFIVWQGRWYPPFYEQIEIDHWPGTSVEDALDAYQRARRGPALRLSWTDRDEQLRARFRSANTELVFETARLKEAGSGDDPHGVVSWRRGRGSLRSGRRTVDGVVLVERLSAPRTRLPKFGRFEMWLYAPPAGGLVLARCSLPAAAGGCAPVVSVAPKGAAAQTRFGVEVLTLRKDPSAAFELPSSWRIETGDQKVELARRRGLVIAGEDPDDKPAAYDFALAEQQDGKASGLVFHLQDAAQE